MVYWRYAKRDKLAGPKDDSMHERRLMAVASIKLSLRPNPLPSIHGYGSTCVEHPTECHLHLQQGTGEGEVFGNVVGRRGMALAATLHQNWCEWGRVILGNFGGWAKGQNYLKARLIVRTVDVWCFVVDRSVASGEIHTV